MSKKGLLIQLDMLGDALNLGVKHTTVNIPYHQLVGGNLNTNTTERPTTSTVISSRIMIR